MSDNNGKLFGILESAFKEASDFLDLKEKVDLSINEISKMLSDMTDEKAYLYTSVNDRIDYSTNSFINIGIKSLVGADNSISICGYALEPIKGFPVVIELDDSMLTCDTPDELKERLVRIISQPEITTKVLTMIKAEDDIPF